MRLLVIPLERSESATWSRSVATKKLPEYRFRAENHYHASRFLYIIFLISTNDKKKGLICMFNSYLIFS